MRSPSSTRPITALLLLAALTGCAIGSDGEAVAPPAETVRATPSASVPPAAPPESGPSGSAPRGGFAMGVRQLALNRGGDRPLTVTIWYPATGRSGAPPRRSAPVAAGRFPVVLFSHGLNALPGDYLPLLADWVAAGFVVAAPAYPHTRRNATDPQILDVINQPADASYVLTRILELDARTGDPLRGRLAVDRVAAAGHSAGGITTIGLFTRDRDDRLDAGVVLAGSALGVGGAFAGTAVPLLFVHGRLDEVVSYDSGRAAYDRVPWPKAMLTLPDGDHGRALRTDGDRSLRVIGAASVEFLRWALYGDQAAKRRLPAAAAGGGLATLDNRL